MSFQKSTNPKTLQIKARVDQQFYEEEFLPLMQATGLDMSQLIRELVRQASIEKRTVQVEQSIVRVAMPANFGAQEKAEAEGMG